MGSLACGSDLQLDEQNQYPLTSWGPGGPPDDETVWLTREDGQTLASLEPHGRLRSIYESEIRDPNRGDC